MEVHLLGVNGTGFPVRALIDSGADCSCFPEEFAGPLGIELEACEQKKVNTGNGVAIHYCAGEPVRAVVAGRELLLTATFGPLGVPVLGREDFFTEFLVTVDHPNRLVLLTPHETL